MERVPVLRSSGHRSKLHSIWTFTPPVSDDLTGLAAVYYARRGIIVETRQALIALHDLERG